MARRTRTKFLLTKLLPFCLFFGVAGEVAYAQAPVVTGVSFFRGPASGDTYGLAEVIVVQVDFDRSITVDGSPLLALRIGTQTRQARAGRFDGVQTFQNIRFSYHVRPSDSDSDGISINANALTANGATIRVAGGTTNATLGLGSHAITNSGSHKVDGSRETTPSVSSVVINSSPASGDTYELGERILVGVYFDRAITGTNAERFQLELAVGMHRRQASFEGVRFGNALFFEYYPVSSDRDEDGISIYQNALTLNGGTIKIQGGTTDAALSLGSYWIRNSSGDKVDGRRETAPTVRGAYILSRPVAGDTYELGETISVIVEFNRPVAVTGSPQLALTMGTTRQASFAEVSDGRLYPAIPAAAVRFRYTVQSADSDADGISISASALTLNGGTIKIAGGSTDATLNLGGRAISNSGGHKVDGSLESAPVVTDVRLRDWVGRDSDTFELGHYILVHVLFDRLVTVTGSPRVALTFDMQTRQASLLLSESSGRRLIFHYVVQPGDSDPNGLSIGANALTLNGGTITRAVGTTNAALNLGSHAVTDSTNHKVDGSHETAATVAFFGNVFVSRPANGDTFELGETILVEVPFARAMAVTGRPQFALEIGTRTRQASFWEIRTYQGVDYLRFRYRVQSEDSDMDGLNFGADALTLNGGTVRTLGGTLDAVLTVYTSPLISPGRKVDGGGGSGGPTDVRVEPTVGGLRVSWQAVVGASAYEVQWRVVGEDWSSSRQVETTGTQYEVTDLAAGDYEVRVVAVVDGEDGAASAPVQGEVAELGNRGPRVVEDLPDIEIDVEETEAVDAAAAFGDADGDRLRFSASSDAGFVSVSVSEGTVRVRGMRPGEATVTVTAEDPAGLTATATFQVAVGALLSLNGERIAAPEGGTVVFALEQSRPLAAATAVRWRLAVDEDVSTADADVADYGATGGEVSIPAGETSATIEVAIADDADIEPAREHFVVQLEQPENENVGLARNARIEAIIQEGVCDRTLAVRNELSRQWQGCHWLRPSSLAAVGSLDLSGRNINALRSNDLLGLRRLRRLDLSNNALEALPAGLFAGLENLGEISVEGNPGAPFSLTVELVRLDAEPWEPGPARVAAQTALGAPFSLEAALSVSPADTVAGELPTRVDIAAGAMAGEPFRVASNNGAAFALRADAATLPTTRCGDRLCFRGFQTVAGPALTLFRLPPRALTAAVLEPVQGGDELRLPLASLIQAEDSLEELRYEVASSDEALATVRIVDGSLVVTPELASAGTVEVTLVVTDTAGLSTTLRFDVRVEFYWPQGPTRGWRSVLGSTPAP